MRLAIVAMTAVVAGALSGCAPYAQTSIDPEQATERAATGAVLGAALGTGVGVISAINPALGAVIGVESGAAVGAAIGVMTTPPIPEYKPIPVPAEAVIPNFYDNWPPGYYRPPGDPETVSPHSG
jgi:hypothetical protein